MKIIKDTSIDAKIKSYRHGSGLKVWMKALSEKFHEFFYLLMIAAGFFYYLIYMRLQSMIMFEALKFWSSL